MGFDDRLGVAKTTVLLSFGVLELVPAQLQEARNVYGFLGALPANRYFSLRREVYASTYYPLPNKYIVIYSFDFMSFSTSMLPCFSLTNLTIRAAASGSTELM